MCGIRLTRVDGFPRRLVHTYISKGYYRFLHWEVLLTSCINLKTLKHWHETLENVINPRAELPLAGFYRVKTPRKYGKAGKT
jgi:hypothetical protein